jgi:hypothetical protein
VPTTRIISTPNLWIAATRSSLTPEWTKIAAFAPTSHAPWATERPWFPSVAQATVMPLVTALTSAE